MTCDELIQLIEAWLEDVRANHLTSANFVQVVESLLKVYKATR